MTTNTHRWVVIVEQNLPGESLHRRIEWCLECGAIKSADTVKFPEAFASSRQAENVVDSRPWGEVCPR